jgi:gluconokinase
MIIIVMGPCGCGKSEVGSHLVQELRSYFFLDADSLHPPTNVRKMAQGIPLSDEDRLPWLVRVREQMHSFSLARTESGGGVVVACSALKKIYRDILRGKQDNEKDSQYNHSVVVFVLLDCSKEVLTTRLEGRKDHFMKKAMLESQLEVLEVPGRNGNEAEDGVIMVNGDLPVNGIIMEIKQRLGFCDDASK